MRLLKIYQGSLADSQQHYLIYIKKSYVGFDETLEKNQGR